MTICRETRRILDLHAGGRASGNADIALRDHLVECADCRSAVADYTFVVRRVRSVFPAGDALPDAVRMRLARNAAAEAARAPWWRRLVPAIETPVWAAVAPALLVAVVVAVPLAIRHQPAPVASEIPVRIDMQAHDGAVSLAWSDGNGKSYRVYKSSDPRQLGQGKARVVQGNQWVDQDPETSPIVFYRVE